MGYSMLDVFRQEVATQVDSLKQSFAILKRQPTLLNEVETALRSLHTLIGAAQLVEMDTAVELAQTMQSRLIAVQQQHTTLDEEQVDRLIEACQLLLNLSAVEASERERWLFQHTEALVEAQTAIAVDPTIEAPSQFAPVAELEPVHSSDNANQANPAPSQPAPVAELEPVREVSSNSLIDRSLLDLFRSEVEAQATLLNNGLIVLETQPQSPQELETLMRAAHSIKGAARIVGLDAAVHLAHVMEDCFVAAQAQTITFDQTQIDLLFRGVDLLQTLSQADPDRLEDWLNENQSAIAAVHAEIAGLLHPQNGAVATPPTPSPAPIQSPPEPERAAPEPISDRVVRVSADSLNRMVGLAGESMIESNWLQPFADSLLVLKADQRKLAKTIETFQQAANYGLSSEETALLETVRQQEQHCRKLLTDRITDLEDYIRRTDNLSNRLYREVIGSQMRPFADGVQSFPRMVRDIARDLDKQVKLVILGETTAVDRDILKKLEAPLTHILRNAIDHGIESPEERVAAGKPAEGTIRVEAVHRGGLLTVTIADDGKGIDTKQLRRKVSDRRLAAPDVVAQMSEVELMEFLFLPGFSLSRQVTELSGRGVGLDIAKSIAQEVGGTVRASSQLGKGTSFYFQLPLTLSVVRTLLVEISGEPYAFPLSRIDRVVTLNSAEVQVAENRQYFTLDGRNIGLIPAEQILNLPSVRSGDQLAVVILSDQSNTYGFVVDRTLEERELLVRPLDPRLGKVQDISAAALLSNGALVLIVDVSDFVRSANISLDAGRLTPVKNAAIVPQSTQKRILVVDDSITVREIERKLLQNRGYQVEVANDGIDGWNAIRAEAYDLVISDIDMPRMNGIELIKQIKSHPLYESIPVIVMSYRDREADRIQGLDAGADYYLTKNSFQDNTLIQAVVDLIGEAT